MCANKFPNPDGTGNKKDFREEMYETTEKPRQKQQRQGPLNWRGFLVLSLAFGGLGGAYAYLRALRVKEQEIERKREVGKASIGGPWNNLIDQDGNVKHSSDFHGKWILLYFGFTHCPDICPDEMEKISEATDILAAEANDSKLQNEGVAEVLPLIITVDPLRDSASAMKEYCQEFHPKMIGLTGTEENIKKACQAYRVYFSQGPSDEDDDYIVDHTIITYLVDPDGNFVDYYGQRKTAKEMAHSVKIHMLRFFNQQKKDSIFDFKKFMPGSSAKPDIEVSTTGPIKT